MPSNYALVALVGEASGGHLESFAVDSPERGSLSLRLAGLAGFGLGGA